MLQTNTIQWSSVVASCLLSVVVAGCNGATQTNTTSHDGPDSALPKSLVFGCQDFVRVRAIEIHITEKSATIVHFIDDPVSGPPPHGGTVTSAERGYTILMQGGGECRVDRREGRVECIDRERAYWFQGWCRQGAPLF